MGQPSAIFGKFVVRSTPDLARAMRAGAVDEARRTLIKEALKEGGIQDRSFFIALDSADGGESAAKLLEDQARSHYWEKARGHLSAGAIRFAPSEKVTAALQEKLLERYPIPSTASAVLFAGGGRAVTKLPASPIRKMEMAGSGPTNTDSPKLGWLDLFENLLKNALGSESDAELDQLRVILDEMGGVSQLLERVRGVRESLRSTKIGPLPGQQNADTSGPLRVVTGRDGSHGIWRSPLGDQEGREVYTIVFSSSNGWRHVNLPLAVSDATSVKAFTTIKDGTEIVPLEIADGKLSLVFHTNQTDPNDFDVQYRDTDGKEQTRSYRFEVKTPSALAKAGQSISAPYLLAVATNPDGSQTINVQVDSEVSAYPTEWLEVSFNGPEGPWQRVDFKKYQKEISVTAPPGSLVCCRASGNEGMNFYTSKISNVVQVKRNPDEPDRSLYPTPRLMSEFTPGGYYIGSPFQFFSPVASDGTVSIDSDVSDLVLKAEVFDAAIMAYDGAKATTLQRRVVGSGAWEDVEEWEKPFKLPPGEYQFRAAYRRYQGNDPTLLSALTEYTEPVVMRVVQSEPLRLTLDPAHPKWQEIAQQIAQQLNPIATAIQERFGRFGDDLTTSVRFFSEQKYKTHSDLIKGIESLLEGLGSTLRKNFYQAKMRLSKPPSRFGLEKIYRILQQDLKQISEAIPGGVTYYLPTLDAPGLPRYSAEMKNSRSIPVFSNAETGIPHAFMHFWGTGVWSRGPDEEHEEKPDRMAYYQWPD